MKQVPILKGKKIKTRILRPSEYEMLRKGAGKIENQTNLDACLLLGARYIECQYIQNNPSSFDGNFITIPEEKKVERTASERWIRLNDKGKTILPYFFTNKVKLPSPQAWRLDMQRWAVNADLDPVGLSPRTLRKTLESWLVYYYPNAIHLIFLSQGHTELTALKHYMNLPFVDQDKADMKRWIEGWV